MKELFRRTGISAACILAGISLVLTTACSPKNGPDDPGDPSMGPCPDKTLPNVLIPEEETPREQFAVAYQQFRDANGILNRDVRNEELEKAIIAFKEVENRFPDDRRYSAGATYLIGETYMDMEQYELAVCWFEHVLKNYPEDEGARVDALLQAGIALDELGEPQKAQEYYRALIDEFEDRSDPMIREKVDEARRRFRRIRLLDD